jgi:hypothetical protein
MTHTVSEVKQKSAPSVKKLLREAGYSLSDVAARRGKDPSAVSRVVRKHATSDLIWADVVWCLNHPKRERVSA